MAYLSANFNSPADGDLLETYTPETGGTFQVSLPSIGQELRVTSGRVRAGSTGGNVTIYKCPTAEPQLDIDVDFDIRVVTDSVSADQSGVIARWDDNMTSGDGFFCVLVQTGSGTANLRVDRWAGGAYNSTLATFGVSVSASTTYHVKYSLRSSGGSTTHQVFWNGNTSPDISVAATSAGQQVVGNTGVVGKSSTNVTGYHIDNLIGSVPIPPTQPAALFMAF